jgi:hypothetical protein
MRASREGDAATQAGRIEDSCLPVPPIRVDPRSSAAGSVSSIHRVTHDDDVPHSRPRVSLTVIVGDEDRLGGSDAEAGIGAHRAPYEEAVTCFEVHGHPTLRNLAVLAEDRRDPSEHRVLWLRVLEGCPGDVEALAKLGRLPA